MKHFKQFIFVFIVLVHQFSISGSAQNMNSEDLLENVGGCCPYFFPFFNKVELLTENYQDGYNVRIIVVSSTANGAERIIESFTRKDNTINILAYNLGLDRTLGVTFIDTFKIGKLLSGTYILNIAMYITNDSNKVSTSFSLGVSNLKDNVADLSDVFIYPNPASDILNIELPEIINILSTKLIDSRGNVIKTYIGSIEKVYLMNLTSGLYFLEIETTLGKTLKKIMIR